MMNDTFILLLSAAGGGFLGVFYFAGLGWTLRKSIHSRWAALWFSFSFLLRSSVCLFGIYWIGENDFLRILACLVGFLVARTIVMKLTADSAFACDSETHETKHAS